MFDPIRNPRLLRLRVLWDRLKAKFVHEPPGASKPIDSSLLFMTAPGVRPPPRSAPPCLIWGTMSWRFAAATAGRGCGIITPRLTTWPLIMSCVPRV